MEPYKRIPCGVYDQLEIVAMRKTNVTIRYRDETMKEFVIKDVISNLKSIDKIEYAIFSSGLKIRLDWILQMDDMVIQDESGCYL